MPNTRAICRSLESSPAWILCVVTRGSENSSATLAYLKIVRKTLPSGTEDTMLEFSCERWMELKTTLTS